MGGSHCLITQPDLVGNCTRVKKLYLTELLASYWILCGSFDLVLLSADVRYCSGDVENVVSISTFVTFLLVV